LDTPPLKLLDAAKHSGEDKRFFLSEQLLNVGDNRVFLSLYGTALLRVERQNGEGETGKRDYRHRSRTGLEPERLTVSGWTW
jgi:hypothetical protein